MGTERKVLIAYGTRCGSTKIVAQDLSAYLKEKAKTPNLNDFDLVEAGYSAAMFSRTGNRSGRTIGKDRYQPDGLTDF
ncbi:MAG: hypothetical protein JXA95_08080 [Spirochaetales bacterium]|nr:hypothetical protein [Spirochaetales bacterium]